MQNLDFSNAGSMQQLANQWYDAAENKINTTKRMELYAQTEKFITFLKNNPLGGKEKIKELFEAFNEACPNDKLTDWIFSETRFEVKANTENFNGAYKVFHDLFNAIDDIETPSTTLQKIDSQSHDKILSQENSLQILNDDTFQQVFSNLRLSDKLTLRETSKEEPMRFTRHEAKAHLSKKQSLSNLKPTFKNIENYLNLLGDQTKKLLELDLIHLPLDAIKLILSKCPNTKTIISDKPGIVELIKDHPKIEQLECHFQIDPRTFPKEHIPKLTGAFLVPHNDEDLEAMFDILIEVLPNFKFLSLLSDQITKLPSACYTSMPNLEEINFQSCKELKEIGDMPNLQKGSFHDCRVLKQVGDMPKLLNVFFNYCTALKKVGNMPNLETVFFNYCTALKEVGNMPNLKTGYFLDCIRLEKIGDMPNLREGVFQNLQVLKEVGDMPEHLNPLKKPFFI